MRWFWACALSVVLVDQAAKAWVRQSLLLHESREVIPGWLAWTHVQNTGAAWNILAGHRWLLVGMAVVVIVVVASAARDLGARSRGANTGLGLVLGGAIGNLWDRVAQGYVTDFVNLETPWRVLRDFPVWNVADAALTIGVALLAIDFLRPRAPRPTPNQVPILAAEPEGIE